jgi:RimJ/RimL family protein N-acetyltransferase
MQHVLRTDRLTLRELGEQDAVAFHALNSDPEVMRYTGEPLSNSVEEARRRLREYPDYRERGYGRWALVLTEEQRVIGFNGLKFLPELGETDIGFRLLPAYWGKGLATESSRAVIRFGFEVLGLARILGLVLPENARSIRVLEKIGMRRSGDVDYEGLRAQRWVIESGG